MSWIPSKESEQEVLYKTIQVAHGERSRVELPDGTSIVLDAGSELKYPQVFTDSRKVFLRGEAFFDVAHDKARPFRVIANHAAIHVLGTQFNVRAWDENPAVTVAVVQGKVSLGYTESPAKDRAILTKGYYSSLAKNRKPAKPSMVDVQEYLDWMHYEIRFRDASVREVLAQLQRWYDYQFKIENPSILDERVNVHIVRTNIEDVLHIIAELTDTKITKENRMIRITSNS